MRVDRADLLQLAALLPRQCLERACDEAEVQEVFDLAAIEEPPARSRGCVLRATWLQVQREPDSVALMLRTALAT